MSQVGSKEAANRKKQPTRKQLEEENAYLKSCLEAMSKKEQAKNRQGLKVTLLYKDKEIVRDFGTDFAGFGIMGDFVRMDENLANGEKVQMLYPNRYIEVMEAVFYNIEEEKGTDDGEGE